MRKKRPHLTVVSPGANADSPRRKSPSSGAKLRQAILAGYELEAGGTALLDETCLVRDRLDDITERIGRDGVMLRGKPHPLLKTEASLRALVCRNLTRLGLDLEPIGDVGAPLSGFVGIGPQNDDDLDDLLDDGA
jgi:hypothetical protein